MVHPSNAALSNASSINLGKKNLLGVNISAVNYAGAVEQIIAAAKSGRRCTTTALAVHGVMTGVNDPEHRHRLNSLDLVVPDGQPVRWGINLLHRCQLPDRVYGPNLMLETCRAAAAEQIPIFLFGATEETLQLLKNRLCDQFPGLQIAGTLASKFRRLESEKERDEMIRIIRESGAKITFAGIGCPRQEVWAFEMGDLLDMPILAVGAAFAFHAGQLSQAPSWMQRLGLEWLYRFACEPKRLWQRYVLLNPAYLTFLGLQFLRWKRFDPDSAPQPKTELWYG